MGRAVRPSTISFASTRLCTQLLEFANIAFKKNAQLGTQKRPTIACQNRIKAILYKSYGGRN